MLADAGELNTHFGTLNARLPYHPPCQLKAHRIGLPARDVLALVPGLEVDTSHATCCGVAGTYGLKSEKYQIAMDVGAPLFNWLKQSASDEALCDSETCRWQISHATDQTTRHPIELLLDAYCAGETEDHT